MNFSLDFSTRIPDHEIVDQEYVTYIIQVKVVNKNKDINISFDACLHTLFEVLSERALKFAKVKSYCIHRRFSEFDFLYETLQRELPTCLIPPLPSKQEGANKSWYKFASAFGARGVGQVSIDSIPGALVGRRFDADLIDSRRQALETFLSRCLSHPRISQSVTLFAFLLESDDWRELSHNPDLASEFSDPKTIPIDSIDLYDQSVEVMHQKSQELTETLERFVDLQKQINRRRSTLNGVYNDMANALNQWCPHEKSSALVADSIQILVHSLDRYRDLVMGGYGVGGPLASSTALDGGGGGVVERAVEGQVRYGAAFARLCSREAALQEDIAEERAYQRKLQSDAMALVNGTKPNEIPSVVGTVNSKTNSLINLLKSFIYGSENPKPAAAPEQESPEVSRAMDQLSNKLTHSSTRLSDLEDMDLDFKRAIAEEFAFLEQRQSADLAATMRVFAAVQLQRAEACKRLWERVSVVVEQARSETAAAAAASTGRESSLTQDGRTQSC